LRKSEAKSRVIILLTDGRDNASKLDPISAAHLAQEYNVRIYTIGAGSKGDVLMPQQTIFGRIMQPAQMPIDEDMLRKIASVTGGAYYRATDTASLQDAYAEINKLETTEIELDDYYYHEEGFVPFAVMGAFALAGAIFVRRLWFEPIP